MLNKGLKTVQCDYEIAPYSIQQPSTLKVQHAATTPRTPSVSSPSSSHTPVVQTTARPISTTVDAACTPGATLTGTTPAPRAPFRRAPAQPPAPSAPPLSTAPSVHLYCYAKVRISVPDLPPHFDSGVGSGPVLVLNQMPNCSIKGGDTKQERRPPQPYNFSQNELERITRRERLYPDLYGEASPPQRSATTHRPANSQRPATPQRDAPLQRPRPPHCPAASDPFVIVNRDGTTNGDPVTPGTE
ncbi:hypothetical protein EVAR_67489_1 [Eumeta japonica]|uniref:Uncharacterized protein n=1 Tax=Eumeta variegata TaxID=151549 RepID=A0A4C1ZHR1_EUMVA|nr:hypothetical protein EVAR_67489_1 [Eumeta japonica]